MKNKENLFRNIFFATIGIYIGFLQLVSKDIIFYGIFLALVFIWLFNNTIEIRNKGMVLWIIPIIYMLLGVFYTYSVDSGIKFWIVIIEFWSIAFILSNSFDWIVHYYKILSLMLSVHVIYTIFSIVFKEEALRISSYILSDDIQYLTSRWVNENGHYSGIAGQTVINALFFSVLLGWFFSKLLIEKKYVFTIGVISILIILIILTGKKGSVGGNLLALFLVLCIYQKISKKSMKYLYILLLLGIGSLLGGAMLLDIERINLIMGSSVISRNRIYI